MGRTISLNELRGCNGERGQPSYVAFEGLVYDVSDCPRWRSGLHEGLHFPGQDLTDVLPEAPHDLEVFNRPCVKLVGKLDNA